MKRIVFLGGTCGDNHWREQRVIPALLARGVPEEQLFNPVVDHWDAQAQVREDVAKQEARLLLFVIASPDPRAGTANVSAYSLVELVMALYDAPERTVALFDTTGMPRHTQKALAKAVADLAARFPGAPIFANDYDALIDFLAGALREEDE